MKIYKKTMVILLAGLFFGFHITPVTSIVLQNKCNYFKETNHQTGLNNGEYMLSFNQPPCPSDESWDLLTSEL